MPALKDGKEISAVKVRMIVRIIIVYMDPARTNIWVLNVSVTQGGEVRDARQILMIAMQMPLLNVILVDVWMVMALTHVIAVVQDTLDTNVIKNVLRHHVKMVCVETYANANLDTKDHIVT